MCLFTFIVENTEDFSSVHSLTGKTWYDHKQKYLKPGLRPSVWSESALGTLLSAKISNV